MFTQLLEVWAKNMGAMEQLIRDIIIKNYMKLEHVCGKKSIIYAVSIAYGLLFGFLFGLFFSLKSELGPACQNQPESMPMLCGFTEIVWICRVASIFFLFLVIGNLAQISERKLGAFSVRPILVCLFSAWAFGGYLIWH